MGRRKEEKKLYEVKAPCPGKVLEYVKKGERVEKGKCVVRLFLMKSEVEVLAEVDGEVIETYIKKDGYVKKGDLLLTILPHDRVEVEENKGVLNHSKYDGKEYRVKNNRTLWKYSRMLFLS